MTEAIAKRADELKDITVISTVTIREKPFETYLATESNDQVRFASAHFSGNDRAMSTARSMLVHTDDVLRTSFLMDQQ